MLNKTKTMAKEQSIIQKKSFEFALSVIELYKQLITKNEYVLSKQLLRSGTSIGANVEEASAGQTKKDFIAKMSIASKEARETLYWLKLLQESNLTNIDCSNQLKQCNDIINILTAIVKTSQQKLNS
jgi:four helix bundle protein